MHQKTLIREGDADEKGGQLFQKEASGTAGSQKDRRTEISLIPGTAKPAAKKREKSDRKGDAIISFNKKPDASH